MSQNYVLFFHKQSIFELLDKFEYYDRYRHNYCKPLLSPLSSGN